MFFRFSIVLFAVLLASCASEGLIPSKQDIELAKQATSQSDKSPKSLLLEYKSKLEALGEESLFFYSPLTTQLAAEKAVTAEALLNDSSSNSSDKAKFELISALRFIDKAASNKQAVILHLKKANSHFAELKKLQTPTLLPTKFSQIQNEFKSLNKIIEQGQVQEAIERQAEFIETMLQAEIETLNKTHLEKPIDYIAKAKAFNANDYAPQALQKSQELIESTRSFIKKSYRDRLVISQMAEEALKAARMLYFISKEAFSLRQASHEELENKIRDSYQYLNSLETSLSIPPTEITDYSDQKAEILRKILLKEQETNKTIKALQAKINTPKPAEQKVEVLEKPTPAVIVSKETNKAVLPELLMSNSYTNKTSDEENLEFDSVEVIQ